MQLKGKTKSGFAFEITEETLDNFELVEALADVDENPLKLPKVVTLLLGNEQKKALFNHVRTEKGTVPNSKVSAEVLEIFKSGNKTKKS